MVPEHTLELIVVPVGLVPIPSYTWRREPHLLTWTIQNSKCDVKRGTQGSHCWQMEMWEGKALRMNTRDRERPHQHWSEHSI